MDSLSGDDEGLMAQATIAMSHLDGVSDSVRARELYKYYQPAASINTDACFVAPSVSSLSDPIEPDREIAVKSSVTSSKVSSPDTALTAFCQLTTWRTGAQRAMISVIDAETQYFIAESTRTVDLNDANKHAPGDEIWMGCSSVSKAGRLCERTIAVSPTSDEDYPCFVVNDLTKDERFCELSFVIESPHLRFYAGVPLITKRGIPIGSLFVVDDRVGHGFAPEKIRFMATMAKTIIHHMEMVREVEEHRRGMKMSRGLASFVEGRAELVEAESESFENTEGSKVAGQFEDSLTIHSVRPSRATRNSVVSSTKSAAVTRMVKEEYSAALINTEEALLKSSSKHVSTDENVRPDLENDSNPNSFGEGSVAVPSPRCTVELSSETRDDHSESSSMTMLFSRAANLIREAFEVDGGAVFYDAQTGFSSDMGRTSSDDLPKMAFRDDLYTESTGESLASDNDPASCGEFHDEDGQSNILPPTLAPAPNYTPGEGMFSRTTAGSTKKTAEILGFSTAEVSSMHHDELPGPQSFSPFGEKALVALLKRYPRGKLWTFDSDGAVSSSSEEERRRPARDPFQNSKSLRRHKLHGVKAKSDAKFLAKHFPGVRQLLFVPLWDAGRSRWLSGCFVWSTEPTRILSKQSELAFLTAFGNSVMAEWARIDTENADQKKGDFIGSISHELRSPLHGILASAEFLDEMTEGRTKQLVETIDSCGRTLLDTINHILDYSKINHFERNWRKTKRNGNGTTPASGSKSGPLALRQSDLPMLNLFQDVNLSVLCEEVVDSVFAGSVYQNITAQSFDMVSAQRMSDVKAEEITGPQKFQTASVAVILDIDLQDYHFITQPGALRRLIMNLLGNSLKYTSHGYVRISLDAKEMEDMPSLGSQDGIARSMVTLTISDTGKGISPEFLRSKLFMPFAQENSLSSGTGLGLSIVRKIVALLEGEITIDSEVGHGTQVQVKLPLLRELPKTADSTNSESTKSSMSVLKDVEDSIESLRVRVAGSKASLQGFDLVSNDPVLRRMGIILEASITTFLVKWYGLQIVPMDRNPDFIICNEANPASIKILVQKLGTSRKRIPSIIVLCSHNSRLDRTFDLDSIDFNLSFVAKPVGPLKLAKTILHCLGAARPVVTPGVDGVPLQPESNDLSMMFEELMLSPRGGEVLDNTRMSADSANARKALETPTPNATDGNSPEFPFPHLIDSTSSTMSTAQHVRQASLEQVLENPSPLRLPALKTVTSKMKTSSLEPAAKVKLPALLVVDDNHINLSLLSTYLNRRKYETIHEAQNGLEAVQQVEKRPQGYDIIFMDITMPILDGFGATRQIRALEQKRRRKSAIGLDQLGEKMGAPALIIAFTGRSSIEDQSEAVRSGIDLFMTKPVAFKEVGNIIDNWLANKEREARGMEKEGEKAVG